MKSICIIGQGNVATHLCVALAGKVDELYSVNSRSLEDLPIDAELYLIAVSDEAIASVAARLPKLDGVVAHTSGSTSIDVLNCVEGRRGVFYPLMTFSKDADIDYQRIPVFIEGSDKFTLEILRQTASLFTDKIMEMDSQRRMKLHIASVFACNFVNSLWQVSFDILASDDVPFRYMLPLIDATVAKLHYLTPYEAQTGPAKRGDIAVIEKHEKLLEEFPQLRDIYHDMTKLIIEQINDKTIGKE